MLRRNQKSRVAVAVIAIVLVAFAGRLPGPALHGGEWHSPSGAGRFSTSPSWAGCTATRCPAGWPPGSASSPWWSRERATSTGSRAAGGPALLRHRRTSRVLQLDQRRLENARRWFDRWGAWAIIFGRHIP